MNLKPSKYFNKIVWACPECMHVLSRNRTKPAVTSCPKCRKSIKPEKFDSQKEFEHCFTVYLAYTSGKIQKPEWHPRYLLHKSIYLANIKDEFGAFGIKPTYPEGLWRGGVMVLIYPNKYYKPDLQYRDLDGTLHVQDVKSKGYLKRKDAADKNFKRSRKIMKTIYNINVEVIE
jgi:hypothetical protein